MEIKRSVTLESDGYELVIRAEKAPDGILMLVLEQGNNKINVPTSMLTDIQIHTQELDMWLWQRFPKKGEKTE